MVLGDYPFWKEDRPFTKFEAWLYMMINASPIDQEIKFRNISVLVKRGDLVTSELNLSKDFNWGRGKVRRFLDECAEKKIIANSKRYSTCSILTLLEYETYAGAIVPRSTAHSTAKKGPKMLPKQNITDMRLAQLLTEKILENNPKSMVAKMSKEAKAKWINDCRKMREIDKRTPDEIEAMIVWSQKHTFWQGNILSMNKLRERFDGLWIQAKGSKQSQHKYSGYAKFAEGDDERNKIKGSD